MSISLLITLLSADLVVSNSNVTPALFQKSCGWKVIQTNPLMLDGSGVLLFFFYLKPVRRKLLDLRYYMLWQMLTERYIFLPRL